MTGFIRRPHLFAAHVNISWCRELFDSEPKPQWLAHFSSLRHKTSPALSSSLLFYNLNFCVSLLFGCVSPSLRRPKPRQVTRSSGLETLIRKLLSFVLNISWKMTILCQIFWQKNVRRRKYSSATQVLHLSCNSELQALHHVVNVWSNTNGTEAGIFQVFFKGGYRPWTPPPEH